MRIRKIFCTLSVLSLMFFSLWPPISYAQTDKLSSEFQQENTSSAGLFREPNKEPFQKPSINKDFQSFLYMIVLVFLAFLSLNTFSEKILSQKKDFFSALRVFILIFVCACGGLYVGFYLTFWGLLNFSLLIMGGWGGMILGPGIFLLACLMAVFCSILFSRIAAGEWGWPVNRFLIMLLFVSATLLNFIINISIFNVVLDFVCLGFLFCLIGKIDRDPKVSKFLKEQKFLQCKNLHSPF